MRTLQLAWINKLCVRLSLQLTNKARKARGHADDEAIMVFSKTKAPTLCEKEKVAIKQSIK